MIIKQMAESFSIAEFGLRILSICDSGLRIADFYKENVLF